MTDSTPGQEPTPDPQGGDGQTQTQDSGKTPLTAEQLAEALADVRREAADTRRKLRDAEARLTEADKAQKAAADAAAAEQGKYQELYESEKARAAEIEATLRALEFDGQRKDAAQAAGIPQLWQRLQGSTPEELAEDAKALAEMMAPQQAAGQQARQATPPTPQAQGTNGLTPEERRARAARTF